MCRIAVLCIHSCPLAAPGKLDAGGMNIYVREISRELGRYGMTVDIFTRWANPRVPQIVHFADHARVIHLKAGPVKHVHKSQIAEHLPEFVCNLRRFKEENGLSYRLIHSHYWLSGWAASFLHQRWDIPHITMFHTLGALKNSARPEEKESNQRIETERKIISSANVIIASTEQEKKDMVRFYGANPHKIRVVPCGVDLAKFRPLDRGLCKERLGLPARGRVLLFVGRIEPLKGLDLLFDVVVSLRRQFDDLRLLILGEDASHPGELHRLKVRARELAIADRVEFVGTVDHDLLPLYYNAADVCVVPSYYESFSLVAAEALACGVPVVASRVGGLESLVIDHLNGLLVPTRSTEAFADTAKQLLVDEQLRSNLARMARRSVQRLGWSAVGQKIMAVYDELADASLGRELCLCGRW